MCMCRLGKDFADIASSVLGVGVFNSDGDMWKFHRTMTRPFFSRDRITHSALFGRYADAAIQAMKTRFNEGYAIDIQDLNSRFTLDSASEFLFGRCTNTLKTPLPYPYHAPGKHASSPEEETLPAAEKFSHAFAASQKVIADRATMGQLWPLGEFAGDKTIQPMKVVRAFLDPIIEQALREKQEKGNEGHLSGNLKDTIEDDETLLDHLVKVTDG